jgi:hypothetical protein
LISPANTSVAKVKATTKPATTFISLIIKAPTIEMTFQDVSNIHAQCMVNPYEK